MTTPVVYWRPGCGYCAALFRELEQAGIETERINIWEDEAGAEFVRQHNNGDEVVPTVDVGGQVFSNPFLAQFRDLL